MATQEVQKTTVLNPNAPEFYPKNKSKMPEHSHAGENTERQNTPTKTNDSVCRQVAWTPSRKKWKVRKKSSTSADPENPSASVNPDGEFTTVMIRNIPCNYTHDMLVEHLDRFCMVENEKLKAQKSDQLIVAYDFLYLPVDFKNGKCLGYGFVNFTYPKAVWRFFLAYHNKMWEHFSSRKICKIAYARLQGKELLIRHFTSSTFACASDEWLPVSYSPPRDGSNKEGIEKNMVGTRVCPPRRRAVARRHGRIMR